jgi:hypothetical protein
MDFLSNLVAPLPPVVSPSDSLQNILDTLATATKADDRATAVSALYEIVKDKSDVVTLSLSFSLSLSHTHTHTLSHCLSFSSPHSTHPSLSHATQRIRV